MTMTLQTSQALHEANVLLALHKAIDSNVSFEGDITKIWDIDLGGYDHPLPNSITQIGSIDLSGYDHPLPTGLTQIGDLDLRGYDHPLPMGITKMGHICIEEYAYPLPNGITETGDLSLSKYDHPLPNSITETGGLDMNKYDHPLPNSITKTGDLFLIGYNHPLPDSLTQTNYLYLEGYNYPLPSSITKTGGLDLCKYSYPLPSSIITTGNLFLTGYNHPLPSSITTTGYLDIEGYNYPLPSSIIDTSNVDFEEIATSYENSANRGMVEFAYLAVNDKMLINKSYRSPTEDDAEYIETHGGPYNSHIQVKFFSAGNTTATMTALLNFEDIDLGEDEEEFLKSWELSFNKILTDLSNAGCHEELCDNIMAMFNDAYHNAGFCGTYIGELIDSVLNSTDTYNCRTTDFQMHEPSKDDLHPGFDT